MEIFKEIIAQTVAALLIILCFILCFFLGIKIYHLISLNYQYNNDKTVATLKVDGKEVYKGRTFFIEVESIGENGNTKNITIYHDKFHLHPVKRFISDRVEMK